MVTGPQAQLDQRRFRLAIFGVVVVGAFVALFSRLWFLQVLASDQYKELADENRVRLVRSEPPRGRILDRRGRVLVDNRRSLAVTVDRAVLDDPALRRVVLRRLARLLKTRVADLRANIKEASLSPFKPVAVATGVPENPVIYQIEEHPERYPGVHVEKLPIRRYPQGNLAAQLLGYVNEISKEGLESAHFANARPRYQPGDIVGQTGVEYQYDRFLRGRPRVERVIVNSAGEVVDRGIIEEERPGPDLVLSLDLKVQKAVERALDQGLRATQGAGYAAPAGAVVVMDPSDGHVVAMASRPSYDPRVAVDGFTVKEFRSLGAKTPGDPDDDALLNRAIQAQRAPGSTYKVVTAGASMATDLATPGTTLPCPPSVVYPPGDPSGQVFRNWTTANFGYMGFPRSLEVSCDTFYYQLGWQMEKEFDKRERFQRYARRVGTGRQTGVDLPNEADGRVPDRKWCARMRKETKGQLCPLGWLPGYSVNMAIGQGDLIVTPMQMAVTYGALASGGKVWEPRVAMTLGRTGESGKRRVFRKFRPPVARRVPLDPTEIGVIEQGLYLVVGSGEGTARPAFEGFPLESYPLAGKTGTAELGETDLQDAWFVSYGPLGAPRYVISVYMEKAGHGGESAAPVAREIWEAIFGLDRDANVQLGQDRSG